MKTLVLALALWSQAVAQIPEHIEVTDPGEGVPLWDSLGYVLLFILALAVMAVIYRWVRHKQHLRNKRENTVNK